MKKALLIVSIFWAACLAVAQPSDTRSLLESLALGEVDDQEQALETLADSGDPFVSEFVSAWRVGGILEHETAAGDTVLVMAIDGGHQLVSDASVIELDAQQLEDLSKNRAPRKLRRRLPEVIHRIELSSPDPTTRIAAALKLGESQDPTYLPLLQARLEKETEGAVRSALREGIAFSLLANHASQEELIEAIQTLGDAHSSAARGRLETIESDALEAEDEALATAARQAIRSIEKHENLLENVGNFFRGLSTGSILLLVSFGLAITFGLMGIINMAHGEFIAIGGYTCYVVQGFFAWAFGIDSAAFQWFFWVSIPVSFLVAGLIGFVLEKSFFRFLYKRPLESLLATWGLSMVMRWAFRSHFGANNVLVETPHIFVGNLEIAGVSMSYARLFAIGFAGLVCVLIWLLLAKTNLGLYIRAVMQNRNMASGLGIPVNRVNSFTFAIGCGLAAIAGVVLTQIANVGPTMGQTYVVDSFMVVVVGGVGNLLGAGLSALGIGVIDQFLQPVMGPVMGKIIVLFIIILFLQWKPGGLFPSKSRSMDD